ncbi:MAG: DUF4837 family protein [Rubricoccaceae bacterium]
MIRSAVFLLVLLALTGCEAVIGTPKAVGEIPQILVVADSTTWEGPVGEAIRAELAQTILTLPNNQGAFKLRHRPLTPRTYESIQRARNVIVAAPIDEQSLVGEFLRERIDPGSQQAIRDGRAVGINLRPDLWSENQLVVLATAADDRALTNQILQRGAEMRDAYNELAHEATFREMFNRGRQTILEDSVAAQHGWSIALQHDYLLVQDSSVSVAGHTGQFVRFRRVLTDTWRDFFVFVEDDVQTVPPVEDLDQLTNGLLEVFARGILDSAYVQMDALSPVTQDTVMVAGQNALETRGLWRMKNDLMGGSYLRYAFVDPQSQRLFVYYGMVFAPNRKLDKREFVRQMEVIGRTLRPASSAPE